MKFKANRKTYIAIAKANNLNKAVKKSEAIRNANKHFKTKLEALEIVSGQIDKDGILYIGVRGNYWVVYRR